MEEETGEIERVTIKPKTKGAILFVLVMLLFVGAIILFFYITTNRVVKEDVINLSICLGQKSTSLYVLRGCSHCARELELFGDNIKNINIVECSNVPTVCTELGINAFPTWKINGTYYQGYKDAVELKTLSGCE
jgi:hypothetical protein